MQRTSLNDFIEETAWVSCGKVDKKGRYHDKAPATGLGSSTKLFSYADAKKQAADKKAIGKSPHYGRIFPVQKDNPVYEKYIAFDVDVDPNWTDETKHKSICIPDGVLAFLKEYPTLAYYSPSGNGLHMYYQVTEELKEFLYSLNQDNLVVKATLTKLGKVRNGKNLNKFCGDVRFRNGFLAFTENLHELSSQSVRPLELDEFFELLPEFRPEDTVKPKQVEEEKDAFELFIQSSESQRLPPFALFRKAMETIIPPTYNEEVERMYKNAQIKPYPQSNREWWIEIVSICANYSIRLKSAGRQIEAEKVLAVLDEWCSRDSSYVDSDDVANKFKEFEANTCKKIEAGKEKSLKGVGTLMALASASKLDFPRVDNKNKPIPGDVNNIYYLVTRDGLRLKFDSIGGGYCFEGPDDIINKYFCPIPDVDYNTYQPKKHSQVMAKKVLDIRLLTYMQDRYHPVLVNLKHAETMATALATDAELTNSFKAMVEETEWDGESRLDKLCDAIKVPEIFEINRDLYRTYIRNFMLFMVGVHFYPKDDPEMQAMLILSGAEHTYKSTFAKGLIPPTLANYRATETSDIIKNKSDLNRILTTRALLVVDECEGLLARRHESHLKNIITVSDITYRDLYDNQTRTRKRTAGIIGTTNQLDLDFGLSGTRKFWVIPVETCDTDFLRDLDYPQLYAEIHEILREYKLKYPSRRIQTAWTLHKKIRHQTNEVNASMAGENTEVYSQLIELFGSPTKQQYNKDDYFTSKGFAANNLGHKDHILDVPQPWAITDLLDFYCSRFPNEKPPKKIVLRENCKKYAGIFTGTTTVNETAIDDLKEVRKGYIKYSNKMVFLMPKVQEKADPRFRHVVKEHITEDDTNDLH